MNDTLFHYVIGLVAGLAFVLLLVIVDDWQSRRRSR